MVGSSNEQPAFKRLVLDGLLEQKDCADPSDLSALANAVFLKFNSQRHLVDRLPLNDFRFARANDGYLLLAALMRERVISSFATLNFDLVPLKALSDVGAADEVAVIRGPEEHGNKGTLNIIYLHRSVDAKPDDWILRTEQLEDAWKNGWEELIALRVVSSPVTVFVGLGSPAQVLIQSVSRVRAAIPQGTHIYQVDPGPKEDSAYFAALQLRDDEYLQMGWTEFMELLSARVAAEHGMHLINSCMQSREAGEISDADIEDIIERVTSVGLLGLGRLRAEWMMRSSVYHPAIAADLPFLAAVLISIKLIENITGTKAVFSESSIVEFRNGSEIRTTVAFIIAPGQRRLALEPKLNAHRRKWRNRTPSPSKIITCGAIGRRPAETAMPESIYASRGPDNILAPQDELIDIEDVRANPALILGGEGVSDDGE